MDKLTCLTPNPSTPKYSVLNRFRSSTTARLLFYLSSFQLANTGLSEYAQAREPTAVVRTLDSTLTKEERSGINFNVLVSSSDCKGDPLVGKGNSCANPSAGDLHYVDHLYPIQKINDVQGVFPFTLNGRNYLLSLPLSSELADSLCAHSNGFSYPSVEERDGMRSELFKTLGSVYAKTGHYFNVQTYWKFTHCINEPNQQEVYRSIVSALQSNFSDPDDQARAAVSLVQNIPYDDAYMKGNYASRDYFSPYETLLYNRGVCGEKSMLLAGLLKEMGFKVALFNHMDKDSNGISDPHGGHMAVGISVAAGHDFNGTGYAFIETTSTEKIITYVTDLHSEDPYLLIPVCEGKSMDVTNEVKDISRMNEIRKFYDDAVRGAVSVFLSDKEENELWAEYDHLRQKYGVDGFSAGGLLKKLQK